MSPCVCIYKDKKQYNCEKYKYKCQDKYKCNINININKYLDKMIKDKLTVKY